MDEETKKRFNNQDEPLKKVYISSGKMGKYFLGTPIITLALIILSLIRLIF